jgi:hypothetical protein
MIRSKSRLVTSHDAERDPSRLALWKAVRSCRYRWEGDGLDVGVASVGRDSKHALVRPFEHLRVTIGGPDRMNHISRP